ncbi:MAG TPA: hypothetical protein VJO35_06935 [Terriglobales bacterium]|nr:hypothetical protein [Terriglobales bacterium]
MTQTSILKTTMGVLRMVMLNTLVMAAPVLAMADDAGHVHASPSKLVEIVRENTAQFINVNNLKGTGYEPAFGCVSGPDHGAMGIHYINLGLVGDGVLNKYTPEALIYEPVGRARRLVGVEYIVDAETWLANNNNAPPQLEGQDFQFVPAPNRFGIPSFFELHVWAWRDNPNGAYVDWNNNVSCEGQ